MQDFIDFLNLKNTSFKCFKSGDNNENLDFSVNVFNEVHEGAGHEDLALLQQLILEKGEEVFEFYKQFNGVKLFCNKDIAGVELFKVTELVGENEAWKEWFSERDENELYDFEKYGIAFGTVPRSGNYFVLYEGRVYYSDHDDVNESPLAESFSDFLLQIVKNPAEFLYTMGCYTRYSDGKSDSQWIPKEFVRTL
jgi:hypothetical protein